MGKARKKPDYDPEKVRNEMIELVKLLYTEEQDGTLNQRKRTLGSSAEELDISIYRVVKLLISGGVYMPDMARLVNMLYADGMTVAEIQSQLGG